MHHAFNFARRRLLDDDEGCDFEGLTDYNMGLHIGSVFILLGVSMIGFFGPSLLKIVRAKAFRTALKLGTFFAFGTVLSTGFIHMLQPSNDALTSPCLPESWNNSYEAYAFLFAILAILAMHAIDFGLQQWQCQMGALAGGDPCCDIDRALDLEDGAGLAAADKTSGAPGSQPSRSAPLLKAVDGEVDSEEELAHGEASIQRSVSVYLMEAGIVFHSVVIGITLGVTTGSQFTTLLIVLSLHQFFEGFAIGFTAIDARMSGMKILLLGSVYALTTPIGVAIGIGIRHTYNGNDSTTLLVQGTFDAISAGILIYVGLVQLITPQFTHNQWFRAQPWYIKLIGFACLYGGVATMAVIGKWA